MTGVSADASLFMGWVTISLTSALNFVARDRSVSPGRTACNTHTIYWWNDEALANPQKVRIGLQFLIWPTGSSLA